ncbi:MAG: hypothetical protein JJE39_04735 [Vicinamibacteria bacterium]|nr:hypothetical protein [Vicinamibacteria bacterium]
MRISKRRSVASVLALSFVASTAGAMEPVPGPSLWNAAQEAGKKAPVWAQTTAGPATGNPRTDSSFFKTTAGRLTLGLMIVGVGLTVYSTSHDRKPVKSPIR